MRQMVVVAELARCAARLPGCLVVVPRRPGSPPPGPENPPGWMTSVVGGRGASGVV